MSRDRSLSALATSVVASRVLLAFAVGTAAYVVWTSRRRTARQAFPEPHEDCEVSECGADGVPLSLYAG